MSSIRSVHVRAATEADIPGVAAVALACGQPPQDSGADGAYVRHLLAHGEVAAAVDEHGRVVGFGATRRVGAASLLTDLFVSPADRGRGIGHSLLQRLWPGSGSPRLTFSSQHPSALPLYARHGLTPSWPLLYLTGAPDRLRESRFAARAVSSEEAAAVELELTAADRRADYAYWLRDDPGGGGGLVVLDDGRPVAAGAAAAAAVLHLACPDPAAAADALVAAVSSRPVRPVALCIPGPHPGLPVLLRCGFTVTDFDIHMSSDPSLAPVTSVYSPGLA